MPGESVEDSYEDRRDAEAHQLESLVAVLPYPVMTIDQSLDIVTANSSALRLLGQEGREPPIAAREVFDSRSVSRLEWFFSGLSDASTLCFRAEPACPDGRETGVRVSPLKGNDGRTIGAALCLSETPGDPSRESLSHPKKIEMLGLYAAGVIHEFNNILAVIAGRAGIGLLADGPAAKERALQNVMKAAQRAEHVVKDLLVYVEKRRPEFVLADLKSVVLEALSLLAMELAGAYVELRHDLDSIPPTMCDPVQVSQVCFNLIRNAKEAMPEGGRIEVRLKRHGSWAVISVGDTGVGVPREMQSRIFDPFVSYGKTRTGQSACAGLGLFVAREIVLSHGGDISLESTPAKGSTFTVRLPVTPGGAGGGTRGRYTSLESSPA